MKKFFLHLIVVILFLASIPLGISVFFWIVGNPLGVSDVKLINEANEFAIFEAVDIQRNINNEGKCPEEMDLWDSPVFPDEYQFQKNIENSRDSIPVWFSCGEDLKFHIWGRYSIDSDLAIKGGKGVDLVVVYGHFSERKNLVIDTLIEKDKLDKVLIREKLITKSSTRTQ